MFCSYDINTVANFVRVFLLATNVTSHQDLEGNSLLTLCLEFQNWLEDFWICLTTNYLLCLKA